MILGASLYLSKGIVNVGVGCSVIEILLTFGLIKVLPFFKQSIGNHYVCRKNFQYLALELNLFKKILEIIITKLGSHPTPNLLMGVACGGTWPAMHVLTARFTLKLSKLLSYMVFLLYT